jgi:hypothetical protein
MHVPQIIVAQGLHNTGLVSQQEYIQRGHIEGRIPTSLLVRRQLKQSKVHASPLFGKEVMTEIAQSSDMFGIQESLRRWVRERESKVLIRCLAHFAMHDCVINMGVPQELLNKTSTRYVIDLMQPELQEIMNKHIDPGASGSTQVNIHPHPCVFFKNSIDSMGSMSLFNPFVIPFVLAVPILITLRHAAIQLMLNDSH